MNSKENADLDIYLNEYQTIKEFRERCIKNIEESTRTYIQFIGFVLAALSIIITNDINNSLIGIIFLILSFALIVGIVVYKTTVISNITFIEYTRKLNITRNLFNNLSNSGKYQFVLSIDENHPQFDNIGSLGDKLSKVGILWLIKIFNSFIISTIFYLFISISIYIFVEQNNNFTTPNNYIYNLLIFPILIFVFIISFYIHNTYLNNKIDKAINNWKEFLKNLKMNNVNNTN